MFVRHTLQLNFKSQIAFLHDLIDSASRYTMSVSLSPFQMQNKLQKNSCDRPLKIPSHAGVLTFCLQDFPSTDKVTTGFYTSLFKQIIPEKFRKGFLVKIPFKIFTLTIAVGKSMCILGTRAGVKTKDKIPHEKKPPKLQNVCCVVLMFVLTGCFTQYGMARSTHNYKALRCICY